MPRVVFRADAGRAIGSGHVMRSLALAAEFSSGGWAVGFAANAETFAWLQALTERSIEISILSDEREGEAAALARRWPAGVDVLVVDHYGRDAVFERACRPWAKRIAAIDDLADRPHDTDVLIDSVSTESAYGGLVPAGCTVLAGSSYAIVAPAFRGARAQALSRRGRGAVERVLVSFGQIDAPNATTMALAALRSVGFGGKVDVALGAAAPHLAAVRGVAGTSVQVHVDARDMARLMSEADLAIGAGGTTAWERCCVGLPSILVTVADNQLRIAEAVSSSGAGLDAGPMGGDAARRLSEGLGVLLADAERRNAMAQAAAALVDGRGSERAWLAAIGPHISTSGRRVTLRLATADDEAWLLALQSQPETRRFANDPTPPSAGGHRRWFAQTLGEPARLLMIVGIDGKRAGMLRIDKGDAADRINIAVDAAFHRQGIGAAVLALAARLRPRRVLEAEVLPSNKASLALFGSAGYRQIDERLFRREPA